MKSIEGKPDYIEKEEVPNCKFPAQDVLKEDISKKSRLSRISKGLKLGNAFKNKVQIFFEDNKSLKKVETTIWAVTEKYLILKKNMRIPIHRVHDVRF